MRLGELELVGDVRRLTRGGYRRVVDLDLVQHVRAEGVAVRAAVGVLERDEVGDEGDSARLVGADEGVDVGVVGGRVLGACWCFAVRSGAPSGERPVVRALGEPGSIRSCIPHGVEWSEPCCDA